MGALRPAGIVNCLSIDVEGFAESNVESFPISASLASVEESDREIRSNMAFVLGLLDEVGVKVTFFFLGRIAETAPDVVREAARRGHEIACHGYGHTRVRDPESFRREVKRGKALLERASGAPVYGYRAPDHSITRDTLWALDVLKEEGYRYDSSILPVSLPDVRGIGGYHQTMQEVAPGFFEFPLSTFSLIGRRLPVGGGYFRLYPYWLTSYGIRQINGSGHPAMVFLHPYEIGSAYPRVPGLGLARRWRHYVGIRKGAGRLRRLAGQFPLGRAWDVLQAYPPGLPTKGPGATR